MPDAKREFAQLFSSTRRGAHLARVAAVRVLAAWGYEADVPALVVAELAANAVAHCRTAGRDFRLYLAVDPDRFAVLRVELSDACADTRPAPRPCLPDDDAEGGRGLVLVEALSLDWGVADRPYGKTVWAEVLLEVGTRRDPSEV
ncbi:ATP-binding protein [Streptomyces sp. NPDC050738]|uniref:ATP-binding protein n=1 Tax=Streptomyces sp. NPDC050738 TaxID=3154744 RepID=UPI0034190BEA